MISRRTLGCAAGAAVAMPFIRPARAAQRLRFAITNAKSTSYGAAAAAMARVVREGSDGRIELEVFTDGVLGSEVAMLAAVRAGTLDLTIVASGLLGSYVPAAGLFDLPFLFKSVDQARRVLDGSIGRDYAAQCQAAGIPVLAWAENGLRHLTSNRPIRQPSDLQGLKLRIMPAPLLLQSFKAMGADARSLSIVQLYDALRLGQFDAEENPIPNIIFYQLFEVQSNLLLTGHTYSAACIAASPDMLDDLATADRALLMRGAEAGVAASRALVADVERTGLSFLREHGMTVVSDFDRAGFEAAAEPAHALAAEQFGAERLAQLRNG